MANIPKLPLQTQTAGQVWLAGHGVCEPRVSLSWSLGFTAGRHVLPLSTPQLIHSGSSSGGRIESNKVLHRMLRVSWLSAKEKLITFMKCLPAWWL